MQIWLGLWPELILSIKLCCPSLEGKRNTSCQSFCCTIRRPGKWECIFLDWIHSYFALDVRKYLSSKGLPLKVLWRLDNVPGPPEPHEFNSEGIRVVYFSSYTVSLRSGVIRTVKSHYTWYSVERIVNAVKEDHGWQNIMKGWEYEAFIVVEKTV